MDNYSHHNARREREIHDPWAETKPVYTGYDPYGRPPPSSEPPEWMQPRKRRIPFGKILLLTLILGALATAYLLFPLGINILILGIDYAPAGSSLARTDTIILTNVKPLRPSIGMLSIPRDLWVEIPEVGENRINTAHFYAESRNPGSGPEAAIKVVEANFDVPVHYYIRLHFDGVREVVDALDGVTVTMTEPTAGYPAGTHRLNGNKALAFARDRSGTDDFFRMQHGQVLIRAIMREILDLRKLPNLPQAGIAFLRSVETNIPLWQLPRLGVAFLRVGPSGIEGHTITREMVTPFTTDQGANVLLPNWNQINNLVDDVFR